MKKIRVNYLMPEHLYHYVKDEAAKLCIPMSTMYIMIVNSYKDSNTALDALRNIDETSRLNKK